MAYKAHSEVDFGCLVTDQRAMHITLSVLLSPDRYFLVGFSTMNGFPYCPTALTVALYS